MINKNDEYAGVIYILTNPSFPQYVKIGYADDVHQRIKELNKSESIPYAFRLYAYYRVKERLQDLTLHNLIDGLNPDLRTIENNDGKKRVREFYSLEPYEAYRILNSIAKISSTKENLVLCEPTVKEGKCEDEATQIRTKKNKLPKWDWLLEHKVINKGDKIYVITNEEEYATVVDGKNVNYKGSIVSYNQFGCKITGWNAIQSYAFMRVNDEKLTVAQLREKELLELNKSTELSATS